MQFRGTLLNSFSLWLSLLDQQKQLAAILTLHNASTGVDIFFSLIRSYFCFLLAAYSRAANADNKLAMNKWQNSSTSSLTA
jgi:hypothetical protein